MVLTLEKMAKGKAMGFSGRADQERERRRNQLTQEGPKKAVRDVGTPCLFGL